MLSNLNSCHGVFIPTTAKITGFGNGTRHYRGGGGGSATTGSGSGSGSHSESGKTNETKRNKKALYSESIWSKIEADFTPELLEEQERMNIPETVHHSPKQTSASFPRDDDSESSGATIKKISALFIKPDINVECLYRKSGIRENCEVCASEVVLTDDGFLTCKNPACSILYKDESSRPKRRMALLRRGRQPKQRPDTLRYARKSTPQRIILRM